ncbi:MAG: diacylglycerol kinase family protein, partial [Bdellovibrionota bacterium]
MKIAVIVNGQAGYADRGLIEKSVRASLFRCDLEFHSPSSIEELQAVIVSVADKVDVLMICGGDGTLNTAVQPLLKARSSLSKLPTICTLPVGTANDLAREMGISSSIERAARLVLEGEVKKIDIIEIESGGVRKYMLTNGGLGIPAVTAELVNRMRHWVISKADCEFTEPQWKPPLKLAKKIIKKAGMRIYELALAGQLTQW